MQTITKEYQVYTFDELSDEAKQKVLDKFRHINIDGEWWADCVLEDRTAKLEQHGFSDVKIYYSGFWSQGDGACFIGSLDNDGLSQFLTVTKTITKYPHLTRALKRNDIYVNIKITHNDRYCHAYSTDIEDYTEMQDNSELTGKLLEDYTAWYKSFFDRDRQNARIGWYIDECNDIYRHLEKEYEYMTDDDAVIETIEANEYTFLADGTVFKG